MLTSKSIFRIFCRWEMCVRGKKGTTCKTKVWAASQLQILLSFFLYRLTVVSWGITPVWCDVLSAAAYVHFVTLEGQLTRCYPIQHSLPLSLWWRRLFGDSATGTKWYPLKWNNAHKRSSVNECAHTAKTIFKTESGAMLSDRWMERLRTQGEEQYLENVRACNKGREICRGFQAASNKI